MSFNDEYEETLFLINTCHVFKLPPRTSSEGYKAEAWLDNHIWTGRCKVIARGLNCEVRLEDPKTGKIFATCPVKSNNDQGPPSIEPVLDSSRYFVLRLEDKKQGRHAFIGIGFEQRTDAFDFNVAIQDHQKFVEMQNKPAPDLSQEPAQDFSIKQGEKIQVNFKVKTKGKVMTSGSKAPTSPGGKSLISSSTGGFSLPPPP